MLFNSYEFLFFFLPLTVLISYFAHRVFGTEAAIGVLAVASLIFYAQHKLDYLFIILFSIAVNFTCAKLIAKANKRERAKRAFYLCATGVIINLGLLGYFKYADFFIENVSAFTGMYVETLRIVLPIGISFFTFQQIAYLVDVYKRISFEAKFTHYVFFVSFFPQLIAGPIVHHKELISQLAKDKFKPFNAPDVALGIAVFILGLSKKILIADMVAPYASNVFDGVDAGLTPSFLEAWAGAVAFTFQIYFDFSAYSEMAIGLALIFGLRLPVNFRSPYRARSMIEYWRRWHITLSTFLRDYLYIPLGGNRFGLSRKMFNIMTVMILGGLWHGASWTFVIWGGLHGLALSVNHLSNHFKPNLKMPVFLIFPSMFVYITITWVFFKATSLNSALTILKGMVGMNGFVIPQAYESKLSALMPILNPVLAFDNVRFGEAPLFENIEQLMFYALLLFIVWFSPSVLRWAAYDERADKTVFDKIVQRLPLTYSVPQALALGLLATLSIVFLYHGKVFLYFQF